MNRRMTDGPIPKNVDTPSRPMNLSTPGGPPHPFPLPLRGREGVGRTGEGAVQGSKARKLISGNSVPEGEGEQSNGRQEVSNLSCHGIGAIRSTDFLWR